MNSNSEKQLQSNKKQEHSSMNNIQQQLQQIYTNYFKPIDCQVNTPLFEQIDHGPPQLCKQLFSIQQNCLIINFDAFDRYYPYLFRILSVKKSQQQLNDYQIKQLLQAADMILAFNGENDRAWNIKKQYLDKKDNNKQNWLNIDWQLRFNAAVCLKNKKSSSYYQYRLKLIQKEIYQLISKSLEQNKKQNKQYMEQNQQQLISQKLQKILLRQHQLMNRVLGRYFRNYFCWMYRVKLIKLIVQLVRQQITDLSQRKGLLKQVLSIQLMNIHKFIQKYCNDYSAYSYIISYINRYLIQSNSDLKQQQKQQKYQHQHQDQHQHQQNKSSLQLLIKQLQWIRQLQQYCQVAYSQKQHYKHLLMYKNHILSLVKKEQQLHNEKNNHIQ